MYCVHNQISYNSISFFSNITNMEYEEAYFHGFYFSHVHVKSNQTPFNLMGLIPTSRSITKYELVVASTTIVINDINISLSLYGSYQLK